MWRGMGASWMELECPVITNCNEYMWSLIVISCWYELLISFYHVPPGSRDCLAHQVWNLLECQQWDGLTHPVSPNVFLREICSLWWSSIHSWWWLGLLNSKKPWLNFTACPVFWSLMTLLKSCLILSFLHMKINNNVFLISWQFFSLHTRSCCFPQTMEIFPVPFKAVRMLSHMVASSQLTKDT